MSDLPQQLTLLLEKHHNHYLFSDYYLDHLLPQRLDWQEATSEARAAMKRLQVIYAAFTPTENEAQTERDWIRPALEALSHVFEVQPSIATPDGVRRPDYVFFPTEEARQAAKPLQGQEDYPTTALAVGDAKHWDRSLDQTLKGDGRKPRDPFTNKNPSWQIYFYMLHTGQAWGILTNGRAWRLYHRDTAHKLNYYYEVDLPALLGNGDVEAFKYFYLFFRQASFIPNGEGRTWLDIVLQASRDYAEGVSEDLKDQVYEALRHVAQGFLDCTGSGLPPDSATLKVIYDNSLILLYRLLFVLYAESRGLLPVQENETYRLSYSLDAIKKEIERTLSKPILPTSRLYWPRLEELFGAINKGNEHLGVPAYNGDLFDPQKHPFLEQYAVGDHGLRQAIDLLARIDTEEGRVFVDYRDLEVRHLGSIYEGLLEYQLRHAEEDLAVVKEKGRERYVPASEGQEVAVLAGRVYLVTDRGERKATGSYYTPDYIVKYIVEQTLEPLLDETFARWADRKNVTEEDLIDDILSLDVLDPAMGSGHFLVEATEYIARYLVGLGLEATAGMKAEAELDYWKRRVVQSCIYGVDLNPLAVELAKLSLWLATVSRGKPLSFLDHHLRCGNSLIGTWVDELGALQTQEGKRREGGAPEGEQLNLFAYRLQQTLPAMLSKVLEIIRGRSDTVEDVKAKEAADQAIESLRTPFRAVADLWVSTYFGNEVDMTQYEEALLALGQVDRVLSLPSIQAAQRITQAKRFFHWELEFPEVFFDRLGHSLREEAGFDAVVGNPPYLFLSGKGSPVRRLEKEGKYHEAENFRREIEYLSLRLPQSSEGCKDYYKWFIDRSARLARRHGRVSLIVSNTWIAYPKFRDIRTILAIQNQLVELIDIGGEVFPDPTVLASIFVIQTSERVTGPQRMKYADLKRYPRKKLYHADFSEVVRVHSSNTTLDTEIVEFEIYRSPVASRLMTELPDDFSVTPFVIHEGEHDLNIDRSQLKRQPGPNDVPVVRDWEMARYLPPSIAFLPKSVAGVSMYAFHRGKRLLLRKTGDTIVTAPPLDYQDGLAHQNVYVMRAVDAKVKPEYICSVLNSRLLTHVYQHSPFGQAGRVQAQFRIDFLYRLPVRRISFTTPTEEREKLVREGITEATGWIEGTEGLSMSSVSFSAFSGSNLGRWLDARLTADPEQSDVVHDLLAHLSEQMIEMNKQKQAEMRGFLDWLADYSGLPVEDWTLKTSLKAYYEQDWEEMRRVLDRNGRKIAKVNVKGREASDLIRAEWEASVEKLRPLLARIAVTDRLIDLIVYRLYGLTEEEVAVVEGE